jgi:DNA-binding transcriptional LysR family regulator
MVAKGSMTFNNFDLNLLIALDALLARKNVTHAGRQVHLSQPAMSGVLARLRQYFHDPLLVQAGRRRGMILTPLAQSLIKPVREILLRVQDTITARSEFDPAASDRRFSLAASEYVIAVLLAGVLQRAAREAPDMTFELWPVNEHTRDCLENGKADFVIAPAGLIPIGADTVHSQESLFTETQSCVAWTGNRQLGRRLSLEKFEALQHVIVRMAASSPRYQDEQWIGKNSGPGHRNLSQKAEIVVPSIEAACRIVVGTERIATVPTHAARLCASCMPLKVVAPPFPMSKFTEVLHWHRQQDFDPGHIWLRGMLKEEARRLE